MLNISEMSDADFLSFLYSERDRENSISQYHGWSSWALIGAIITLLCTVYFTSKNNQQLDWVKILFYWSGCIAFYLAYHSWALFFLRSRGYNYARVRMLQDVIPWSEIGLIIISAAIFIVSFLIHGELSLVFGLWCAVLLFQVVTTIVAICKRDCLVPPIAFSFYFPTIGWNIAYYTIMGGLFAFIGNWSFREESNRFLNSEFEMGACFAALFVLIHYLFKLNLENKVVNHFDEIIDRYVYANETKADAFQKILCNRMGYGILEVCKVDLQNVQKSVEVYEKKEGDLTVIRNKLSSGNFVFTEFSGFLDSIDGTLNSIDNTIYLSKRLIKRAKEILSINPIWSQLQELNTILDTVSMILSKAESTRLSVKEVSTLIERKMASIKSQGEEDLGKNVDRHNKRGKKRFTCFCKRHLKNSNAESSASHNKHA